MDQLKLKNCFVFTCKNSIRGKNILWYKPVPHFLYVRIKWSKLLQEKIFNLTKACIPQLWARGYQDC